MGYLALGAMAGVGQEYLKQSGEERQNKFQEIRDRRLAELTTTENVRAEGVRAEEAKAERTFRAGESEADRESNKKLREADNTAALERTRVGWKSELGRGERGFSMNADGSIRKYGEGQTYEHAPSAASLEVAKQVYRRGKDGKRGAAATYDELFDEWQQLAYIDTTTTDELGNQIKIKMRDPSKPGLTEYYNSQVTDEFQLDPNDIESVRRDPDRLWKLMISQPEYKQPGGEAGALKAMRDKGYGWWVDAGGATGAPANLPGSSKDPLDDPTNPSPGPGGPDPSAQMGSKGYLALAGDSQKSAGTAAANTADPGQEKRFLTSLEIQREIEQLQRDLATLGKGRGGNSDTTAKQKELNEQIAQYKIMHQQATERETAMLGRGRPAAGQQPATQVATGQ